MPKVSSVHQFVGDYKFQPLQSQASYVPTATERMMIEDAIEQYLFEISDGRIHRRHKIITLAEFE